MSRRPAVVASVVLACATVISTFATSAASATLAVSAAQQPAGSAYVTAAPDGQVQATAQKPTVRELLQACKTKTDVCKFHPSGPPKFFLGNQTRASKVLNNCTNTPQSQTVSWSKSASSSNSVGVAITASAGFQEVYEVSLQFSYSYTWEKSKTFTQSSTVTVPPHHKGWIEVALPMAKASGQYELHFGNKFYDHYIWYVNNYTETGPRSGSKGHLVTKTPAMSKQEIKQICK